MLKIVSPTGCVHAVDEIYSDHEHGFHMTMCNHANALANFGEQYHHKWDKTSHKVTCKRCLYVLNKKVEHLENDWTTARRGCEHRYPHLKYGVMCRNKCYLGTQDIMRKCHSLYCPIPHVPSAVEMVAELVRKTITNIAKEHMRAESIFRLRFSMIAVHCKWAKPAIQDNNHAHRCTCPELKKWGKDPKFGWCCIMQNCPHMQEALTWRNRGE
jgi:hypothetical protein